MRNLMKFKIISFILIIGTLAMGQDEPVAKADTNDLQVGDIAPSWALMYAPGKFEFLKNWAEEEGKRLRKFQSQPDRQFLKRSIHFVREVLFLFQDVFDG